MYIRDRKEAQIVRLSVQLADLGGQVARKDYLNTLSHLREEINEAQNNDLGTKIIGEEYELVTKCKGFINFCVLPTVGKTANAFLGKLNPYSKMWRSHAQAELLTAVSYPK